MVGIFSKQRFSLASETTTSEEPKKFFQKPKHSKEYIFLADCIEDVVQTKKYFQQN